ncbi:MAG: hypothetical protein AAGB93_20520 [Planctomycetota bacterium]
MSIDPKVNGVGAGQSPSGDTGRIGAADNDPKAGAAFRALLERLEEKSRALESATDSLDDARHLGDAVQSARASVEEAVLLGGDLLEAYRAAQQRASAEEEQNNG